MAPRRKADMLLWTQYRSSLQLTEEVAEEALSLIETHQDRAGLEAAATRHVKRASKRWAQLAEGVALRLARDLLRVIESGGDVGEPAERGRRLRDALRDRHAATPLRVRDAVLLVGEASAALRSLHALASGHGGDPESAVGQASVLRRHARRLSELLDVSMPAGTWVRAQLAQAATRVHPSWMKTKLQRAWEPSPASTSTDGETVQWDSD